MDIVQVQAGAVPSETMAAIDERAKAYIEQSRASNTKRAYSSDWAHFSTWCEAHGLCPLPASNETVARYIAAHADSHRVSTLQRRLAAISSAHRAAGYAPISTREEPLHSVWSGIRRAHGTAQQGKAPAIVDDIRAMVSVLPDTIIGIRDRALLLVGFAGAFRRSELVGLDVEDVEFRREGLVIHLRRSKTDQEGQGREVGIPYGSNPATCPVRALEAWLEASGITTGPLFRPITRYGVVQASRLSDKAVALVIKRCAERAGLDPSRYAGHSLRAGLATSAAMAGASERAIMQQTGHRSVTMVRRYIRQGSLFQENAAARVGL